MWNDVLNVAISNGIFATLFVFLLIFELKDSSAREKKYQKTIDSLATKLGVVQDIKQDVEDIKKVVVFPKKGKKTDEKI